MNNIVVSWIRTVVPVLIGSVVAYATSKGIEIDSAALEAALVPAAISLYYLLARWAEAKLSPQFGWLLGYANAPEYTGEVGSPTPVKRFPHPHVEHHPEVIEGDVEPDEVDPPREDEPELIEPAPGAEDTFRVKPDESPVVSSYPLAYDEEDADDQDLRPTPAEAEALRNESGFIV